MTSNSPEIQLRNLTEWFAAKANNDEPFSVEGAAHFLSVMRSVTADVRALRVLADGYFTKVREVTSLELKCALLELEVKELREKPLMSINLSDAVIIPITEGEAAS